MPVQTDIVLGATLDLVAGEATFQDAGGKRHVTVEAPSAGAGKVSVNGMGKVEIGGVSNLSMLAGEQTTIDLQGSSGRIVARAMTLGAGTSRIDDLLGYVKALEQRIATLEARR